MRRRRKRRILHVKKERNRIPRHTEQSMENHRDLMAHKFRGLGYVLRPPSK